MGLYQRSGLIGCSNACVSCVCVFLSSARHDSAVYTTRTPEGGQVRGRAGTGRDQGGGGGGRLGQALPNYSGIEVFVEIVHEHDGSSLIRDHEEQHKLPARSLPSNKEIFPQIEVDTSACQIAESSLLQSHELR